MPACDNADKSRDTLLASLAVDSAVSQKASHKLVLAFVWCYKKVSLISAHKKAATLMSNDTPPDVRKAPVAIFDGLNGNKIYFYPI